MNVHRPRTNRGATSVGLAGLDQALGEKKWDVIHFNFGLHDAKLPPEGIRHSPPDVDEKNLRELVARLNAPGAKLIWGTTTPVPNGGNLMPTHRTLRRCSTRMTCISPMPARSSAQSKWPRASQPRLV